MTAPVLASRVMRARRTSICPVCRCPITVGQQIAKRGTWQHIQHVIEHNQPNGDDHHGEDQDQEDR